MDGPLLEVRHLVKHYRRRAWWGSGDTDVAVSDVSFAVAASETFGVVGESGSGKTTTARCALRLVEPTSGAVRYRGEDVLAYDAAALRRWRRDVQMVFQDPYASLSPRMRIGTVVREPLDVHGVGRPVEREARVAELLALVGLDPEVATRLPQVLSGGQRQRVAIARALALSPQLLVADEPVSALDVSVQAQVVQLLRDLQKRLGLTCMFITHDLRLARAICTRVAVMYRGRIVEMGPVESVFARAQHAYTQALLSAMLLPDPEAMAPQPVPYVSAPESAALPLRLVGDAHWAAVS